MLRLGLCTSATTAPTMVGSARNQPWTSLVEGAVQQAYPSSELPSRRSSREDTGGPTVPDMPPCGKARKEAAQVSVSP